MNPSGQFLEDLMSGSVKWWVALQRYGFVLLCLVLLMMPTTGWTQEETYKEAIPVAENPEIEKRMLALTEDLRCLVCQNESIADSRAEFSNDIRRIIRDQIKANKTDAEIIEFLVDRYGDFVLYNPPMKATTILLWFGPLIFFILSTWFLIKYLKGRRLQVEEINLTEADQKKAAALLDEKEMSVTEARQEKSEDLIATSDSSTEKHNKTDVSTNKNKGNNV